MCLSRQKSWWQLTNNTKRRGVQWTSCDWHQDSTEPLLFSVADKATTPFCGLHLLSTLLRPRVHHGRPDFVFRSYIPPQSNPVPRQPLLLLSTNPPKFPNHTSTYINTYLFFFLIIHEKSVFQSLGDRVATIWVASIFHFA